MRSTVILLACDHAGCDATTPAAAPGPGWRAYLAAPSGPGCWGHLCPVHATQPGSVPLCARCHERGVSQSQPYLARRGVCSVCYQQLWKAGQLPPLPTKPRPPAVRRDCTHKQAGHRHGTYAAYTLDRCRCDECRDANRTYEQQLDRAHALHRWDPAKPATPGDLVPARRARAHLKRLMAAGMGLKTIARTSGISHGSLSSIMYRRRSKNRTDRRPRRRRITRDLERRILAVTVDLAGGAKVDGAGTRRRLQALVAIGWSQQRLAALIGMTPSNFGKLIHSQRDVVRSTADSARQIYDAHWAAAPVPANRFEQAGITRAVQVARDHGWVPPLAWDGDTIDDPAAQPDVGQQQLSGRDAITARTRARIEDARELVAQGEPPELIAARLGTTLYVLHQMSRRWAPEMANAFGAAATRARAGKKAS